MFLCPLQEVKRNKAGNSSAQASGLALSLIHTGSRNILTRPCFACSRIEKAERWYDTQCKAKVGSPVQSVQVPAKQQVCTNPSAQVACTYEE
eukprot:3429362-Amphidinium_carterae.1